MPSDSAASDVRALLSTIQQPSDSKATGAPSRDTSLHPTSRNQPHISSTDTDSTDAGRTELHGAGHNQGTARVISAIPVPDADKAALHRQLTVVEQKLREGWHTIAFLAILTGGSPAGISARIRDCRRLGWNVIRRLTGKRLYEYRIDGRAPLVPAKRKPRDSRLDELEAELRSLREVVERIEAGRGGER